jgi:hypothetical protein
MAAYECDLGIPENYLNCSMCVTLPSQRRIVLFICQVLDVDLKEHGRSLNVEKCRCSNSMMPSATNFLTLDLGTYGRACLQCSNIFIGNAAP